MAVKIRSKATNTEYDINTQPYEGGILSAIEVPPSSGVWCPVVVYDDAVSIGTDKLEVQTPRVVSDLFWAYDGTFVADTRINPTVTGAGAIPVLALAASETRRYYTTANSTSSTATYEVALVNPNNYKVQFCTNVEGTGGTIGGTTVGFPANNTTAWVNIEPTGGFYLVRSLCSDTHDQTIYMRYERSGVGYDEAYRLAPNFPKWPTYKEGIGTVPIGTTSAVQSKGFCLVWGNSGEPTEFGQGTHEEERYMLSQPEFRHQAPFYAYNVTPTNINVNQYNFATGEGTGSTVSREVNMNYLLDDVAMDRYIEYLVRSGLNGFGILHYANNASLGTFRQKFRALTTEKRRGAKAFHIIYSQGDGSTYTESIANMVTDVGQSWYFKVEKGGNQVPVFMALIDSTGAAVAAAVASRLTDINAIKSALGISVSYNVLMTTNDDLSSYIDGTNWDAKTNYYTYGEYGEGFADVARIARLSMQDNASSKKLVPMVSAGLDQRARYWLRRGHKDIGFYAYQSVVDNIQPMIQDAKGYCDAGNSKFWMVGVSDENTEQGQGFFPTINAANVIDDRVIEKCRSILNPTYVNPTV